MNMGGQEQLGGPEEVGPSRQGGARVPERAGLGRRCKQVWVGAVGSPLLSRLTFTSRQGAVFALHERRRVTRGEST